MKIWPNQKRREKSFTVKGENRKWCKSICPFSQRKLLHRHLHQISKYYDPHISLTQRNKLILSIYNIMKLGYLLMDYIIRGGCLCKPTLHRHTLLCISTYVSHQYPIYWSMMYSIIDITQHNRGSEMPSKTIQHPELQGYMFLYSVKSLISRGCCLVN